MGSLTWRIRIECFWWKGGCDGQVGVSFTSGLCKLNCIRHNELEIKYDCYKKSMTTDVKIDVRLFNGGA